jgi:hypothetical protein
VTRLAGPSSLLLCVAALAGCPSTVPYKPQGGVLEEVDGGEARARLRETTGRAIEPPIVWVQVDDESLRYRYREPVRGPFGIPTGSKERTQEVFYVNVRRVELWDNDWVYMYGVDQRLIAKLCFDSEQDARSFADLLTSFRERRVRGMRRAQSPAPAAQ